MIITPLTWIAPTIEITKVLHINRLIGTFTNSNPTQNGVTLQTAIEHLAVKGHLGKGLSDKNIYRLKKSDNEIIDFVLAIGSNGFDMYYYNSGANLILCTAAQVAKIFQLYEEVKG